jgi:hypothetical protein
MAELLHVEVSNPDDPMVMPAYGGDLAGAGEHLIPGTYKAYVHYSDDTEGYAVLTISEEGAPALLRPLDFTDCTCVENCGEHPPTACSLDGFIPHVHPDDGSGTFGPCPVHPDAPGDL